MAEIDYTPSMHYFRRQYANRFTAEADVIAAEQRFDAALAAHDAEVEKRAATAVAAIFTEARVVGRAGVVAEEPEWEYGYELIESDTRDVLTRGWPFDTAEQAQEHADDRAAEEFDPEYPALIPQVVRRRKAGAWLAASEWVPVKQEGVDA